MSVITFWSDEKEETAKTSSIAAIATLFTLENNFKCLLTQTHHRNSKLESCFWQIPENEEHKIVKDKKGVDVDSGIDGLFKLITASKLTKESISNYRRAGFNRAGHRIFRH